MRFAEEFRWLDSRCLKLAESSPWGGRFLGAAYRGLFSLALAPLDRRPPVARVAMRVAGHPLTMIAVGSPPWSLYFAQLADDGSGSREPMGRVPLTRLRGGLRRWEAEADIVVVRGGRLLASCLARRYFVLPEWIRCVYNLDRPLKWTRSLKHSLRPVVNGETDHCVTGDLDTVRWFYERMHRPMLLVRYGGTARLFGREYVVRTVRCGGLMLVRHRGRAVAGSTFEVFGDSLRVMFLGVLDADPELYREHVPTWVYYHLIELGRELGCRRVDFGGSRPVLTDGLTTHKLSWNMVPATRPDSHYDVCLRVCRDTPAVRELLVRNPFFCRRGAHLAIVACRRAADDRQFDRQARQIESITARPPAVLVDCGGGGDDPRFERHIDARGGLLPALERARLAVRRLAGGRNGGRGL